MKASRSFVRPLLFLLALLVLVSACLVSCGGEDSSAVSPESPGYSGGNDVSSESGSGAAGTVPADRKIVRSGTLTLETTDFIAVLRQIEAEVTARGGYLENSRVSGDVGMRTAGDTVRIPAAEFDGFLDFCAGKATVLDRSTTAEDITESYADTEAHLTALRAQATRLTELLGTAQSVSTMLEIEKQLSDVRYQIEYYQTMLNRYDSRADYSTLHLTLREVTAETAQDSSFGTQMGAALRGSLKAIKAVGKYLLLALLYSWPFLLIAAAIIVLLVRNDRRQRRKREAERAKRMAERAAQMPPRPDESVHTTTPQNGGKQ